MRTAKRKTGGAEFLEAIEEEAAKLPWVKCEREGCNVQTKLFRLCIAHLIEELESW